MAERPIDQLGNVPGSARSQANAGCGWLGRRSAAQSLLTGRPVGYANLRCLLPNASDLFHREEARHLDVLNGTG
jgi:hypothetical protein